MEAARKAARIVASYRQVVVGFKCCESPARFVMIYRLCTNFAGVGGTPLNFQPAVGGAAGVYSNISLSIRPIDPLGVSTSRTVASVGATSFTSTGAS